LCVEWENSCDTVHWSKCSSSFLFTQDKEYAAVG